MTAIDVNTPKQTMTQNFLEQKHVKKMIDEAVQFIVSDIFEISTNRSGNGISESTQISYRVHNDRSLDVYHGTKVKVLHISAELSGAILTYWKRNGLDKDKSIRPCRKREFTKGCYLESVRIINEKLRETLDQKAYQEIQVEISLKKRGYFDGSRHNGVFYTNLIGGVFTLGLIPLVNDRNNYEGDATFTLRARSLFHSTP